jgi:hypothetical protein
MTMTIMIQLIIGVTVAWSAPAGKKTLNSFKELETYLQGSGASPSLDGFLDKVAKDYPGTLENFALVYASRSLQNASPEFPRVIAYGQGFDINSAAFTGIVLTFTGDPAKADYNSMEVMSVDDGKRIQLAEVRFPGTSGAPKIEKNPARCVACHGERSRPIWDSYPVWPGAYGSEEDQIDARSEELANFVQLQAKFGKPGRYKNLKLHAQKVDTPYGKSYAFGVGAPNEDLGLELDQFADRDIVDDLRRRPNFDALKYAFLGAAGRCFENGTGGWFSTSAETAMGLDFNQVKSVTLADITGNEIYKTRRFFNIHGNPVPADGGKLRSIDPQQRADSVRYASLLAGDDMRTWSKSFSPRAFSFATRGLDNVFFVLYDQLKSDKTVADAVKYEGPLDPQVDCQKLAPANQAAVTDAVARQIGAGMPAMIADLTSDGIARQATVLRCISCHTDPLRGPDGKPVLPAPGQPPFIPFDEPMVLGRMLAANGGALANEMIKRVTAPAGDPGRMPKAPFPPLTASEQAAVTELIKVLAADGGP